MDLDELDRQWCESGHIDETKVPALIAELRAARALIASYDSALDRELAERTASKWRAPKMNACCSGLVWHVERTRDELRAAREAIHWARKAVVEVSADLEGFYDQAMSAYDAAKEGKHEPNHLD